MTERVFIDTNILVYAFLENDTVRHDASVKLMSDIIGSEVFVSIQVMSEIYAAISKNGVGHEKITEYLCELEEKMNIQPICFDTVKKCLSLKKKYSYSYWDSLILASSLKSGCTVVYSEDMQHRQVIEQTLTIMNPFLISSEKNA
jgi:predicted nucleic acid-binding protein